MRPVQIIAYSLDNEEEAKKFLRDVGVRGPSLHPHVNSDDKWKRWNGWNYAVTSGVDAGGMPITLESHHYASGHVDFSTNHGPGIGSMGSLAFRDFAWPITVLPARPVILHPEHTPKKEQ